MNHAALNTIDRKFDMLNWEIYSWVWKAARELGCEDELLEISPQAKIRHEIVKAFYKHRGFGLAPF